MTTPDALVEAATARLGRLADHPAKLAVDVTAVCVATVPLWSHRWLLAAVIAIVPGLVATAVLAGTDRGRSVRRQPTGVQLLRVAALALAVWAAWTHRPAWLTVALLAGAAPLLPWQMVVGAWRRPGAGADGERRMNRHNGHDLDGKG